MKRINIAGRSLLTGTALADAVLAYAVSLARLHRFEVAEVPFIDEDGTRQCAQLVLGDGCPIWTSSVEPDGAELMDGVALAQLRARIAELEPGWGGVYGDFED
ncbi:hypothetical protein [Humibacter ginsengiterrae]